MPTIITEEALPNNTIVLTMAFTDEDDNPVTPEDPTTWTLTDSSGTVINARSAVAIVEDTSVDVVLKGDDLAATGVYDDGIRLISVVGDYDSAAGTDLPLDATHLFLIGDNIKPVTLNDAKRHLNIGLANTDHNLKIAECITAARERVEAMTNRKMLTQTVTYYWDEWPSGDALVLPYGKLQSVTSISYKDTDGDWNTWSSTNYVVQTDGEPGKVVLDYGKSWPTTTLHPSKPIRVIYSCGYGTLAGSVPYQLKSAILLLTADLFEQRETEVFGVTHTKLNTIGALVANYRIYGGFPG